MSIGTSVWTEELIWKARPEPLSRRGAGRARAGPGTRRRLWRGPKRRVARLKGLAGDRRRLSRAGLDKAGGWRQIEVWK